MLFRQKLSIFKTENEHGRENFKLPISSDLARLINFCRSDGRLAGELAHFVVDLDASRKRAFAKLTVRDLFPEST